MIGSGLAAAAMAATMGRAIVDEGSASLRDGTELGACQPA
jgi:hypothetical protein